jgi:hypothetical protein
MAGVGKAGAEEDGLSSAAAINALLGLGWTPVPPHRTGGGNWICGMLVREGS